MIRRRRRKKRIAVGGDLWCHSLKELFLKFRRQSREVRSWENWRREQRRWCSMPKCILRERTRSRTSTRIASGISSDRLRSSDWLCCSITRSLLWFECSIVQFFCQIFVVCYAHFFHRIKRAAWLISSPAGFPVWKWSSVLFARQSEGKVGEFVLVLCLILARPLDYVMQGELWYASVGPDEHFLCLEEFMVKNFLLLRFESFGVLKSGNCLGHIDCHKNLIAWPQLHRLCTTVVMLLKMLYLMFADLLCSGKFYLFGLNSK